jgi:hypothetical protein
MKFAVISVKVGKVLVVQFTPTLVGDLDELGVATLKPLTNSVEAHCVVSIFEEPKLFDEEELSTESQ